MTKSDLTPQINYSVQKPLQPLGLYVHVPFCLKKCPYCDFFSRPASNDEMERYTAKVCKVIQSKLKTIKRKADTLYFGGGTPSLLSTNFILRIIDSAKPFLTEDAEITLEVNPASLNENNSNAFAHPLSPDFEKLKAHGLNRVSVGAQSFIDKELKALGRLHNSDEIIKTIKHLQQCGIENISADLMAGIPNQDKKSLTASVNMCAELNVMHISAYLLKIEERTPFFTQKEQLCLPDDDGQAELYNVLCESIRKLGFAHYEISNFAKRGFESRHNLKYWNCDEYLGIGPSAHSFIGNKRFFTPRSLESFYKDETVSDGIGGGEDEYIMLRLRLSDGVLFDAFERRFKSKLPNRLTQRAQSLSKGGFVTIDDNGIRLTEKGFLLSNAVISQLLL